MTDKTIGEHWLEVCADLEGQIISHKVRIEALTAENERLRDLLKRNIDDDPCWLDHHGYCQAHYLEEDCSVAAARAALEKQP
jgi:hypothetical protein